MQFESLVEMENWRRKSSSFIDIYDDDYTENNIRFIDYPDDSDKPLYQRPEGQKKTGVSGKKSFAILSDPINIVSLKVELLTLKVTIIKQRDLKWIFLNIYLKKNESVLKYLHKTWLKIGWLEINKENY